MKSIRTETVMSRLAASAVIASIGVLFPTRAILVRSPDGSPESAARQGRSASPRTPGRAV